MQLLVVRADREHRRSLQREHGRRQPANVVPLPFSLRGVVSLVCARDVAQTARRDDYLLDRLARRWSDDN